jgi:excisionase family DNA binding protein
MIGDVSESDTNGSLTNSPAEQSPPFTAHRQASAAKAMPRLLSIRQTASELGIGRTILYELIAAKKLKTVKIGRRRFVRAEALDEFIAGLSA